jgi:retinol dehydrogenase-12
MAKFSFLQFVKSQRARPLPLVTEDLTGKIVMITGANIGLGFEAAKHFASMNPERLILACRSEAKGKQAIEGNSYTSRSSKWTKLDYDPNRNQGSDKI